MRGLYCFQKSSKLMINLGPLYKSKFVNVAKHEPEAETVIKYGRPEPLSRTL